jgi:hypothetical protein
MPLLYCPTHGAVTVSDGPPNQYFKCPHQTGGTLDCGKTLTPQPSVPSPNVTPNAREAPDEKSAKQMRQGAFLAAYEENGRVIVSAAAAGIDKRTFYRWMVSDPDFERAFRESDAIATQHLEDHAVKLARGLDGATTSERLLIKLLESKKPEVYNRPTRMEHSGPQGGPIETSEVNARDALRSRIASLTTSTDTPSGT